MSNVACVNDQGEPRGSNNPFLALTDPILQHAIIQKVMQQNGIMNNRSDQVNINSTNHPDSSVQVLINTNVVTPQAAGKNLLGNNSEENNVFLQTS